MEQNSFEKNIQQKLDELKIPPSDTVWTNVEKRIGEKDKERKRIFILFFIILFLLSGGYWLLNSSKNNTQQKYQLSEVKKDSKPTNNENSSFEKTKSINHDSAKMPDSANVLKESKNASIVKIKTKTSIANQKFPHLKTETPERKQVILLSKNENQKIENQNKLSIEAGSKPTNGNEIVIHKENITKTDSVVDKEEIKDSSENKIQQIAKKESKKSIERKHPWKFGIVLSGGISMIEKNSFQSAALPNPAGNYNGNPGYYYTPSEIKNSKGLTAGIFIEKNISKKKKLSAAISYQYFSLVNKVGKKVDSTLVFPQSYNLSNRVYSSVINPKTYRNNYHYLEVPVSIKFQLNNNSNLPLFWDAGINISELINTNALQFNSREGLYYSDNSLFNKTQFGISTGISATFFAKGKLPFNIGPFLNYNATSLSHEGLYSKKHFSFIGLRTEILFPKK